MAAKGSTEKKNKNYEEWCVFREVFKEYKELTPEQERALLERRDDADAVEQLICHSYRKIHYIIKNYQYVTADLSYGDLYQLAVESLMSAIRDYDLAYDVRLFTFAGTVIRRDILRCIRKNSTVRVSDELLSKIYTVIRCEKELTQELERSPTPEEIAKKLDITMEELEKRKLVQSCIKPESLSQPCFGEVSEIILADTIEDENSDPDQNLIVQDLHTAMSFLTPREEETIRLYYGFDGDKPLSQAEIAQKMGLSKQRIQQIESRAFQKLVRFFNNQRI